MASISKKCTVIVLKVSGMLQFGYMVLRFLESFKFKDYKPKSFFIEFLIVCL